MPSNMGQGFAAGVEGMFRNYDASEARYERAREADRQAKKFQQDQELYKMKMEDAQMGFDAKKQMYDMAMEIKNSKSKRVGMTIQNDLRDYSISDDIAGAVETIKSRWKDDADVLKVLNIQNINTLRPLGEYDINDVIKHFGRQGVDISPESAKAYAQRGLGVSVDGKIVDLDSLNIVTGTSNKMTPTQKKIYNDKVQAFLKSTAPIDGVTDETTSKGSEGQTPSGDVAPEGQPSADTPSGEVGPSTAELFSNVATTEGQPSGEEQPAPVNKPTQAVQPQYSQQEQLWADEVLKNIAGVSTPITDAMLKAQYVPETQSSIIKTYNALIEAGDTEGAKAWLDKNTGVAGYENQQALAQIRGDNQREIAQIRADNAQSLADDRQAAAVDLENQRSANTREEIRLRASLKGEGQGDGSPTAGSNGKTYPNNYSGAIQLGQDVAKTYNPKTGYSISPSDSWADAVTAGQKGMSTKYNQVNKELSSKADATKALRTSYENIRNFTSKYSWDSIAKAKQEIQAKVPDFLRNSTKDLTGLSDKEAGLALGIKGEQAEIVGALAKAMNGGGNLSNADKQAAAKIVEASNFFTNSKTALMSSKNMYERSMQSLKNSADSAINAGFPYAGATAMNSAMPRNRGNATQPNGRATISDSVIKQAISKPNSVFDVNGVKVRSKDGVAYAIYPDGKIVALKPKGV